MHPVSICPKNGKKIITEDMYETMALWSLSPKKVDLELSSVKDNKDFKKYNFTYGRNRLLLEGADGQWVFEWKCDFTC